MPEKQNRPLSQARKQAQQASTVNVWFSRFANKAASVVGHPYTFLFAIVTLIGWAVTGPIFHFSNAWQLIINSVTNIVTFIVVFVIQNTQNRDSQAINLKLDELIRSQHAASDEMIDIEKLSDQELEHLKSRYESIRKEYESRKGAKGKRPAA